MSDWTLTKTRLFEGVWEGVIASADRDAAAPEIEVTHLQQPLGGIEMTARPDHGDWVLRVPVPADRIADGVQTFVIRDRANDMVLDSFSLVAGDALASDLRAEISLLREELDLLKRAFRRHCLETM